jgi:hypothetical protein
LTTSWNGSFQNIFRRAPLPLARPQRQS